MRVHRQTVEYGLIVTGLLFTFLYFPLRAIVLDSFAWAAIIPVLGFLYIVRAAAHYLRLHMTGLDWVFLMYAAYGVGMTVMSIFLLGSSRTASITTFIHYYAPTIVYFLARSYTYSSPANVVRVTKVIWLFAAILVLDIAAEYYIVEVQGSPLSIPWVRNAVDKIPFITPEAWDNLNFGRVRSFLAGRKTTGMMLGALFAFIIPFLFMSSRGIKGSPFARSWQASHILNFALVAGLSISSFVVLNKTAMTASVFALTLGLVLTRSVKATALTALLLALGLLFAPQTLMGTARSGFVAPPDTATGETPKSAFSAIVDARRVLTGYAQADAYTYLFGQASGSETQTGLTEATFSEARGLAYPLYFGLGWTVIVAGGIILVARYNATLLASQHWRLLGLAIMGFTIIYVSDQHYPSFMRHGAFELFLVMAGLLSSAREMARVSARAPLVRRSTADGRPRGPAPLAPATDP